MSRSESPATGRALFSLAACGVAAVLLAGGCAVGGGRGDDKPRASAEPRPELAERAAPLDPALTPSTTAAGGGATTTIAPGGQGAGRGTASTVAGSAATTTTPGSGSGSTPAAPAGARVLGEVTDPTGDNGIGAPAYDDFVKLTFSSAASDRDLQVVVDVAGPFPSPLGEREVIGIGVDIYRTNPSGESDYQLFADGGADGWRAFLQTPDGFVEYPGTFTMGGSRLVFQVPWSSIGGRRGFAMSAFADWSDAAATLARDGHDAAPNLGTRRIDVA